MPELVSEQIAAHIRKVEMEEAKMLQHLAVLRGRLSGLREALALVQSPMDAGHQAARPSSPRSSGSRIPDPARSPGWAFVLRALDDAPADGHSIDALVEMSEKNGTPIKGPTLRSILSHATRDGITERVSPGHYKGKSVSSDSGANDTGSEQNEPPDESSGSKPVEASVSQAHASIFD